MKKFAVLIAVVLVAALAAPALSATNPFMDVPMNHWAYDAIGQLAAHGILSGYPDGTYKGQQQTTRYELASALARSLAVVDMTKASKQDVEMLKRLVVEFKDELEALGVRVDELDERIAVFENRLGGWHIHGVLALDLTYQDQDGNDPEGVIGFDDAKLIFERTWGENDEYQFVGRLNGGGNANAANFDRFFAEVPFFFDTRLTVGRFAWAWEGDYKISMPETGSWMGDQLITDWNWAGFGLTKNFGLGTVQAALAHPDKMDGYTFPTDNSQAWMLLLGGKFQFTEQIGFDLGVQAFFGDNADSGPKRTGVDALGRTITYNRTITYEDRTEKVDTVEEKESERNSFNNMWTLFAGLRFNVNDNIGIKGVFYHQAIDTEHVYQDRDGNYKWQDYGYGMVDDKGNYIDDANHWALMVDVKQEALKFTSLWLEYGQYDKGFATRSGSSVVYHDGGNTVENDLDYWRVGLGQEWNEKWATHIFYYGYKYDMGREDRKPFEFGLGVQYKLNDATTMGLNYMHVDYDDKDIDKDDVVRLRTKITF